MLEPRYYALMVRHLVDTRRVNGVNQTEMAEHLGVTVNTVSNWETGNEYFPAIAAARYAEYVGLKMIARFDIIDSETKKVVVPIEAKLHSGEGLGETLKKVRKASSKVNGVRISQEWVAEKMGLHRHTIRQWESGQTGPDLFQLTRFGSVCGAGVDLRFTQAENEKSEDGS